MVGRTANVDGAAVLDRHQHRASVGAVMRAGAAHDTSGRVGVERHEGALGWATAIIHGWRADPKRGRPGAEDGSAAVFWRP